MAAFQISTETAADRGAREQLLDAAFGPARFRKSSETLRRGRLPAEGLALSAHDGEGRLVGTVRLWHVEAGNAGSALLLGPLAVAADRRGDGIGSALMTAAIERAATLGHRAILLVGDAPYYARFGFSPQKAAGLAMPGPFERHRFLGLELVDGALDGARGVLRPTGQPIPALPARQRRAAG